MPLSPEDVQNKRFTVVRFKSGYDEEEVDSFLDEVEAELRRMLAESTSLRQAAETASRAPAPPPAAVAPAAPPPPAPAPAAPPPPAPPPAAPPPQAPPPRAEDPNETALRTLLLAQRTADDAVAQAHSEAQGIVNAARAKADQITTEAYAAHAARVAALEHERSALEAEIHSLRGFEQDFRTRLKAYLEGQLGDLASRATVASALPIPAAPAPAAPAPASPAPPAPAPAAPAPAAPAAPAPAAPAAPVPPAAVPSLAPPVSRPGLGTPGPFSAAPAPVVLSPATPPAPAAQPAPPHSAPPHSAPPQAPVAASPVAPPAPLRPGGGQIDTDVDAGSDAPFRPPVEAVDEDQSGPGS